MSDLSLCKNQFTWHQHSLFDPDRVLFGPLSDLLVHLRDFVRVHGPQASLLLASGRHGILDLLEAFVETQIVTNRVFPARRSGLEIGEMFAAKKSEENRY